MFNPSRFEENKEEEHPVSAQEAVPAELELREKEKELKARYEDPYRHEQAKALWNERKAIREKETERIEKLTSYLADAEESHKQLSEGEQRRYLDSNVNLEKELEKLDAQEESLRQMQENRSFLQKLKYRFVPDPLVQGLEAVSNMKKEHVASIGSNVEAMTEVGEKWNTELVLKKENLESRKEEAKKIAQESRKDLLQKTHDINRASREAIRHTQTLMEKGELDIAKLARENNAVVVHGIPLDGWSMANTSMNNEEVDTKTLTAKEKADILIEKQPDVSASILSVDTIKEQRMFYPFAYIVDGKMIAAYQEDVGTIADKDARRLKEEYKQSTLQANAKEEFEKVAHAPAKLNVVGGQHNESIVHKPVLKGVLLDQVVLDAHGEKGDVVTEYFPLGQREEILKKFPEGIDLGTAIAKSGPYAGQETFRLSRSRSAKEKAIEYAREHHPELPIYVRKADSIYTLDGKKVTADDIYA